MLTKSKSKLKLKKLERFVELFKEYKYISCLE